ncbi:hypothetical protein [Microtetraspora malaysiensis]|uniref:Uncharacterized protein n=1 Tax=Microtetraspora malaysiensis TaxID=161358 RepID=A0ABW6SMQ7_9ACTN
MRAHDGRDATPSYTTTGKPGDYRPTPSGLQGTEFTNCGATPFLLHNGHQFRG